MADETFLVHDTRLVAIDRVLAAARRAVQHWDEFGPEAEFQVCIDDLAQALIQWNRFWPPEVTHG